MLVQFRLTAIRGNTTLFFWGLEPDRKIGSQHTALIRRLTIAQVHVIFRQKDSCLCSEQEVFSEFIIDSQRTAKRTESLRGGNGYDLYPVAVLKIFDSGDHRKLVCEGVLGDYIRVPPSGRSGTLRLTSDVGRSGHGPFVLAVDEIRIREKPPAYIGWF